MKNRFFAGIFLLIAWLAFANMSVWSQVDFNPKGYWKFLGVVNHTAEIVDVVKKGYKEDFDLKDLILKENGRTNVSQCRWEESSLYKSGKRYDFKIEEHDGKLYMYVDYGINFEHEIFS